MLTCGYGPREVKGSDAPASLGGLEVTRNNQLVVGPTLQTTRDPRILAVGDCSSLALGREAKPLPPTAQVAHQQAAHLIRHLPTWVKGRDLPPFTFRDFGSLVSLGGYGAYGSLGKFGLFKRRIHPGARGRTGPCPTLPQ